MLAGFARLEGTEAGASWLDADLFRPQQSRQYITPPPQGASEFKGIASIPVCCRLPGLLQF